MPSTRLAGTNQALVAEPLGCRSRSDRRSRKSLLRLLEERLVLAVALFFEPVGGDEAHRGRVHAITLARRRGAVIEDVAEMRVGVRGTHFGARIADLEIGAGRGVRFLQRPG